MSNFIKLKFWMDEVYHSPSFNRDLLDKFFQLDDDDDRITDINELIHTLDASGEFGILKKTPEFLMDYYVVKEMGELDKNELKELRRKLFKKVHNMDEFDSYEEFKEVLEAELAQENK